MCKALLLAIFSLLATEADAAVEVSWYCYVHNPSGQTHFVMHEARYRRGMFFGSCGPSTRSLQWEYSLELKGEGPEYGKESIEVKDANLHVVCVESGSIRIDRKRRTATIELVVNEKSGRRPFLGNGKFKVKPKS